MRTVHPTLRGCERNDISLGVAGDHVGRVRRLIGGLLASENVAVAYFSRTRFCRFFRNEVIERNVDELGVAEQVVAILPAEFRRFGGQMEIGSGPRLGCFATKSLDGLHDSQ